MRKTKKHLKKVKKFTKTFLAKFLIKLASRVLEIAALIGIGYVLGLHLVRY